MDNIRTEKVHMAMQQQEMWGKKGERRRRCGAGRGTRATEMWGREGVQEQKGRCGAAPLYWWPRPAPTGGSPVPCPAPAPQWNMWHPGHRDMWATRSPETCQPPSSSPHPRHPPAPGEVTTRWWLKGGNILGPSPGGCEQVGATTGGKRGG